MKDEVKVRKSWPNKNEFDPSTKIHKVKTDYKRAHNKKEIKRALDEMEEDDLDFFVQ